MLIQKITQRRVTGIKLKSYPVKNWEGYHVLDRKFGVYAIEMWSY